MAASGGAQQRAKCRLVAIIRHGHCGSLPGRLGAFDGVQHVSERLQDPALQRIPANADSALPPPSCRRQNHSTGPDSAYAVAAASSVFGGSTHSAISTPTAIGSTTNGTRSDFGPIPPLKLL